VVLLIALVGSIGAASFILKASIAPSLQAPTLISPPNGATNVSVTPTFEWSPVSDALSYWLQLSTSPDFSSPLLFEVAGPPYTLSWEQSLSRNTTYYWRVRAAKGSVEFSSWSSVWSFTTGTAPSPSAPFSGVLSLENVENGSTVITIRHRGGDRAPDVVENSGGTVKWKNLELRVNYGIVDATNIIEMVSENRRVTPFTASTATTYSMVAGDRIKVQLGTPLKIGDKVSLKWVPTNQLLVEKEVIY